MKGRTLTLEALESRVVQTAVPLMDPASVTPVLLDAGGRPGVVYRELSGVWAVQHFDGRALSYEAIPHSENLTWVAPADVNRDGRQELVGFATDGTWYVGTPAGTWARWGQWTPPSHWVAFRVGDFNADGAADVAGFSDDGQWWVGVSAGTGFQTAVWARWSEAARWRDVQLADVTGDGRTDAVGFNHDGSWWVAAATATGFRTEQWAQWSEAANWRRTFVADVDGDRRADLLGFSFDGSWWVGRSTKTSFETGLAAQWMEAANWRDVQVTDVNGDGRADLLGLTHGGDAWVGLAAPKDVGFLATTLWGTLPYGSLAFGRAVVGDFTGDGASDFVFFDDGPGYWRLAAALKGSYQFSVAELSPFSPRSPWLPDPNRAAVAAAPVDVQLALYRTDAAAGAEFARTYQGVLRRWVQEADAAGVSADRFTAFVAGKLNGLFPTAVEGLRKAAPGLSLDQYRALMAMNLAHGYYTFGPQAYDGASLSTLAHLTVGDSTEAVTLLTELISLQGGDAQVYGQVTDYLSAAGVYTFRESVAVSAGGLLLDPVTNTAIAVDLVALQQTPPRDRLRSLLAAGKVISFYNAELAADRRAANLARGTDPGAGVFYYHAALEGLGQGATFGQYYRIPATA